MISACAISITSSILAWIMLERFFTEISLAVRFRIPGIETISLGLASSAIALPNRVFNCSACFAITIRPCWMSVVKIFPPNGITAVCLIILSWKIAMSVVPPPMSIKQTPASFSSSLSTAILDASGSKIKSCISRPALRTHLFILLIALVCAVMIWKSASSLTPLMPTGSLMPSS